MNFGIDWAGIDGNRNPDLAAARAAGVTFGFRKAYQSPYGPDSGFARDWAAMLAAGVVRSAYVFPDVRPGAAAAARQVDGFATALDVAGGLQPGDMAPAFDVEFPGGKLPRPIAEIVAFLEDFATAMHTTFGCWPILYTSARVWDGSDTDALRAPKSWLPDRCPLWDKTGYRHQAGARIDVTSSPTGRPKMPAAWSKATSPGAWVNQWDGDQKGLAGFSSTIDVNRFLGSSQASVTPADAGRVSWLQTRVGVAATGTWDKATDVAIRAWQTAAGLVSDGDIGPKSFSRLSRLP